MKKKKNPFIEKYSVHGSCPVCEGTKYIRLGSRKVPPFSEMSRSKSSILVIESGCKKCKINVKHSGIGILFTAIWIVLLTVLLAIPALIFALKTPQPIETTTQIIFISSYVIYLILLLIGSVVFLFFIYIKMMKSKRFGEYVNRILVEKRLKAKQKGSKKK